MKRHTAFGAWTPTAVRYTGLALDLAVSTTSRRLTLLHICLGIAFLTGCTCPGEDPAVEEQPEEKDAPEPFSVPYDGTLRLVTLGVETAGELFESERDDLLLIPEDGVIYMETWQRLDDHRIRLVDSRDRLVPFELDSGPVTARTGAESEPGGTWFRLKPASSLGEGHAYRLQLEPELADRITDHKGRPYEDLSIEVRRLVTDEPDEEGGEAESGTPDEE